MEPGTHKEVKPKHIIDLSVPKKLGSNTSKVDKEAPEETRMKHLQDFDPRIESHRNIIVGDVSTFFRKLQLTDENIVLFKSIESLGTTNHVNFESVLIKSIVNKVMLQPNLSENEYTQKIIEACTVSSQTLKKIERATIEQSENQLWFDLRLGQHHCIKTS